MKIIIFEGISGSGKSTIISELKKLIYYDKEHNLFIDRSIHSNYVFNYINNRNQKIFKYIPFFIAFWLLKSIVINIKVDPEVAYKRCIEKKDIFINSLSDIILEKTIFDKAFRLFPLKRYDIDTNNKSLEDIILEVRRLL